MARTAVADLHARLTADVTQYDAEMKRAAAITQRAAASIDGQLTQLQRNVAKKFSVGDIGKDILRGAGLFGGFQIANTLADQIVGHFREQAQFAQATEESMAKQMQITKEMIRLNQTEGEQMETLRKERDHLWKSLQAANANATTAEQRVEVNKLAEAYGQASLALAQMEVARDTRRDEESTALMQQVKDAEARANAAAAGAYSVGLGREDLRAGLRRRQTEIHYLTSTMSGATDPESLKKRKELTEELLAVNQRLAIIYADEARLGAAVGDTIAAHFEDAIFAGEKLSDVLRNLAQDLMRLFFRETIGAPLAKAVSAGFRGLLGFADGGRPPVGTPSVVGERGPELFVPDRAGTIVPNHKLGGGGSGPSLNLTYNFQTGVTRQEIAGILPQMVEATKRAVADAVSRGGSYRQSFA